MEANVYRIWWRRENLLPFRPFDLQRSLVKNYFNPLTHVTGKKGKLLVFQGYLYRPKFIFVCQLITEKIIKFNGAINYNTVLYLIKAKLETVGYLMAH